MVIFLRVAGRSPENTRQLCHGIASLWGEHPRWRDVALYATRDANGREPADLARAVQRFVQRSVRFVPEAGEQIQAPGLTLIRSSGDCDDQATLVAALLQAVGVPWRMMLLARGPGGALVSVGPDEALGERRAFHIWTQAILGGGPVDLETCDPRAGFGEHPAELMRRVAITL